MNYDAVRTASILMLVAACQKPHAPAPLRSQVAAPVVVDDAVVRRLVAQLDLAAYRGTSKGLTQFGGRRQGTDRNRRAIDWIEARLRAYGCADVERLRYVYTDAPRPKSPARTTAVG